CVAEAKKDGKKVDLTDDEGKILPPERQPKDSPAKNAQAVEAANARAAGAKAEPIGAPAAEAPAPAKESKPGQGAWANYDFIPGERVLFADDFSADRVGNFPKRLELIIGNLEVVDAKGVRYLRATSDSKFAVNLPETLPQRFTMEFDLTMPWNGMIVYPGPDGTTNDPVFDLSVHKHSLVLMSGTEAGVKNAGGTGGSTVDPRSVTGLLDEMNGHLFRIRVHGDGKYIKVYMDEHRVANIPNADFMRTKQIIFELSPGSDEASTMVGNISINAGGRDLYDALVA